jgi:hypothetical protein
MFTSIVLLAYQHSQAGCVTMHRNPISRNNVIYLRCAKLKSVVSKTDFDFTRSIMAEITTTFVTDFISINKIDLNYFNDSRYVAR